MRSRTGGIVWLAAGALALGACATTSERAREIDGMLAAAGFQVRPVATTAQQQQLAQMKPLTMMQITRNGEPYWVVADPVECKCLYVGNEEAYQRYERLKLQKQYQDEALMTAEMNEDAAMDWGMWGPWGMWGY